MASNLALEKPKGPSFVDTQSCRCSLQPVGGNFNKTSGEEVWRCLGNYTTGAYTGYEGKYFKPVNSANLAIDLKEPIYWDGNPPDTKTTYIRLDNGTTLTPMDASNEKTLSLQDDVCTGQNDTSQSEIYYAQINDPQGSLTGPNRPCLWPGGAPVTIQNDTSWNQTGCFEGFQCLNNSVVRLPQYCPPIPQCQEGRLSGASCGVPMGSLEPVICPSGKYCPKGGLESIQCPNGHHCPMGSFQPLSCGPGASCPPGTDRNMDFLPLLFLIILDVILIILNVYAIIRASRKKKGKGKKKQYLKKASTFLERQKQRGSRQYENLEGSDEEIPMEPRIGMVKRAPTGFLANMEDGDFMYAEDDEETGMSKSTDLDDFVQSLSRCQEATSFGLSFDFEDLMFKPKKATKPVISEISGKINAGTLVGVMGGSGAGKSTFVNVLMGKQAHTGGVTKVNGAATKLSKYRKVIGFVPQDDIVLPELTVRENILHSARIRLPENWSDKEIQRHTDILISCLELSHVKNSLVGSPAKPVISGGQRKRVSIGIELAAAPMALFLDEPTSGLDATSAGSIMQILKSLSRLGITVVTIIHQPRQEIFETLDSLILLGQGRMLYSGPEFKAAGYFENLGFRFPEHGNPADTIMDIIAGQGGLYKKAGDTSIASLIEHWKNHSHSAIPDAGSFISSGETKALQRSIRKRGAPWYKQLVFCFNRAMLQQFRSKSSFYFEVGVGGLAGFLIGLAEMGQRGINFRGIYIDTYSMLSSSVDYSSVPQMALLIALAVGLTASSPGVKVFGEEKLVYYREAAAGHNRFAYYMGKVLSTFPRMFLANIHFTILWYLLATPRISWAAGFIANFLYFYCIYGLASCISMISRRDDGPLLATMISLVVGILSGMSPSLKQVSGWHMTWLWRASPGTWLAEGYFDQNISPLRYLYQIDTAAGYLGYTLGQFWLDLVMLLVLGTAYRVVAFAGLRLLNQHRQR